MTESAREDHWRRVYETKGEREVSWFQEGPGPSLDLIEAAGIPAGGAIVDIGGGASRLVDALVAREYEATVLDLSAAALDMSRERLGSAGDRVRWLVADVTKWTPDRLYDLWHDRAAFHFLTEEADRAAYRARLMNALKPGGCAIIATFAPDGPERCSGLPVVRYDAEGLARFLGADFRLVRTLRSDHATPAGGRQKFQFSLFERRA